jgi:hypothetical protein
MAALSLSVPGCIADNAFHFYSITSSARSKIDGGIVKPSAFAVVRLTNK